MCVTSEYLIVIADGDVHYYDVASGKPAGGGDALTAQLKKTPANLEFGNSPVLLCCFWMVMRKTPYSMWIRLVYTAMHLAAM